MVAILALLLAGLPADPVPLAPSGPWQVDYAENSCALTRDYGSGDDKVSVGLLPLSGDARVRIAMLAPRGRLVGGGEATLTFDGKAGGGEFRHFYYATLTEAGSQAVIIWNRTRMNEAANAKLLSIKTPGRTLLLPMRGVAKALVALEACEKDLLVQWGYDPSLVAEPIKVKNPTAILTSTDYPRQAIAKSAAGETIVRIGVGADGLLSECTLLEGTGHANLDGQVCPRVRERGKFEAAKDKDGKTIKAMTILVFR